MTKRLLSWESQFVQQISYSSTALIIAISDRALLKGETGTSHHSQTTQSPQSLCISLLIHYNMSMYLFSNLFYNLIIKTVASYSLLFFG